MTTTCLMAAEAVVGVITTGGVVLPLPFPWGGADYALAAAAEDEGQGHREGKKFPNHFKGLRIWEDALRLIVRLQYGALCEPKLNVR